MPYLLHNGCGQFFYEVLLVLLQVACFILLVLHENRYLYLLKSHRNSLPTENVQIGKWVICPTGIVGRNYRHLKYMSPSEMQRASWIPVHKTHAQLFQYIMR